LRARAVRKANKLNAGFLLGIAGPRDSPLRLDPLKRLRQLKPHLREMVSGHHDGGVHGDSGLAEIEDEAAIVLAKVNVGERPGLPPRVKAPVGKTKSLIGLFQGFRHVFVFATRWAGAANLAMAAV
jgi:hypothetical protein